MKVLFEQFINLGWKDEYLPLAIESEIEKVEQVLETSFPKSYRTFAKEYLNIGLRRIQFLPFEASQLMYLLSN